ncbi:MAG: glycosyltransferase [Actinomycetota bacterium]|nr:glycosyltransferase [Actinomycetota bacterium]
MTEPLRIVILGLSVTSSWGNGHATNYRGLMKALSQRGHSVLFLERDVPWYASQRDLPEPPYGRTVLYDSLAQLYDAHDQDVRDADLVVVGSYVPEGVEVGKWVTSQARGVTAFYDIDTPVTLAKLARGDQEYLAPQQIACYDVYLSFTGGPTLNRLESEYGARRARAFYCIADPEALWPEPGGTRWDLGYLGTYSDDRQPALDELLVRAARLDPALSMVVAGPQYPEDINWPVNVQRIDHLAPAHHRGFYNSQRFTLNITRRDMVSAGYSPSVRLFEAAACGVPVISDAWPGLEEFFVLGEEILIAGSAEETLQHVCSTSDEERREIGERARQRVLNEHTAEHRVRELETYVDEVRRGRPHLGSPARMAT